MEIRNRLGGCVVELYIPFQLGDITVERIEFGPWKFDYTLRWRSGGFKSDFALMVELAGLQDGAIIRELREVDAQRVSAAFLSLCPSEVQQDIAQGITPGQGIEQVIMPEQDQGPTVEEPILQEPLEPANDPDPNGMGFDLTPQAA